MLYESPIGVLSINLTNDFVTRAVFMDSEQNIQNPLNELEKNVWTQLDDYFWGGRKHFSLPLLTEGTEFQKAAWQALTLIPYGQTRCYSEQAAMLGKPKAVRAVGHANNKNPLPIFIPCHRVIGKSGELVGYGGGLWRKQWLLAHEQKYL
jgi:methylated-DNA-[protein]-cysteine S-methyltransferase